MCKGKQTHKPASTSAAQEISNVTRLSTNGDHSDLTFHLSVQEQLHQYYLLSCRLS